MPKIRLTIALFAVAGLAAAAVIQTVAHIARDLHADIAWANVDAPPPLRERAYRFYPLTYPVLERWTRGADDVRAGYAIETIGHFGGPLAAAWLRHAINDHIPAGYGGGDTFGTLDRFGVVTAADRRATAFEILHEAERVTTDDSVQSILVPLAQALGPAMLEPFEKLAASAPAAQQDRLAAVLPYPDQRWTAPEKARYTAIQRRLSAAAERQAARQEPARSRIDRYAERLTGGDVSVRPFFATLVDGNLHAFSSVTYMPNLIAVGAAYPQSRLMRGFLAYDAIRGGSYFDRDDTSDADTAPALHNERAWRQWLQAYPDHPGADDAAYWLARGLLRQGDRSGALRVAMQALEAGYGDGDMSGELADIVRWLLDAGMSDEEITAFVKRYPHGLLAPAVRYAQAVRLARSHAYATALAALPADENDTAARCVRAHLVESGNTIAAQTRRQRELWRQLAAASFDGQERVWNSDDGWQAGYLALYDQERDGGTVYADEPGTPRTQIARNMQAANVNAQRIALSLGVLRHDPGLGRARLERERLIRALYAQVDQFPDAETVAMGEPAGFAALTGHDRRFSEQTPQDRVLTWWSRQQLAAIDAYVRDYPAAEFTPTALLCAYEVSGDRMYLRTLLTVAPQSSRSDEARALLWRDTHG